MAKSKKRPKPSAWDQLTNLIAGYAQAAVDESWKGGGDPADVEVCTLRLSLAKAELMAHLERMQREYK